jgi:hypothetical protein
VTQREPQRPGFAAAFAVCTLAAIAALAAASFHTIAQARRAANRSARHEQAASAADVGLRAALASWDVRTRDSLSIGAIDSGATMPATPSGARTQLFLIRLTREIYWMASAAEVAAGTSVEATRVHNLLVEVLRPAFPTGAAIMSRAGVVATRDASILGDDAPPPGWTDCPPTDTGQGTAILLPDGETASFDDGHPMPGVRFNSVAADSISYQVFGRVLAPLLAGRATIVVESGAILSPAPDTDSGCRLVDGQYPPRSWGEPLRSSGGGCERFLPIVHATGDLTLTRGRGQGVLLVAGRLRIEGPFVFHGVILAREGIYVTGPGVQVYGTVLSAGTRGVIWRGAGELQRSTCAITRAAEAAARPYLLPVRGWVELF